MEPLGRRIAKQRAELGWTQARLAERVAISRVALSHLEAGLSVANERTVALLAGAFGVEPLELVAGTDYPDAKLDRLPAVVARHTEASHRLGCLAADVAWIDLLLEPGAAMVPAGWRRHGLAVLQRWTAELTALAAGPAADPDERARVRQALTDLGDLAAALRAVRTG